MKQQIAGFLGELAEELGWAPELDEARVRPEVSRPARPPKPAVLTPDPQDPGSLATPVDRLRVELAQLRATVKHLGSEVIQLRAQMAHLRHLPAPPDAPDADDTSDAEAVSTIEGAEPEARPWPPQLVTKPAAKPPSDVSGHQPVTDQASPLDPAAAPSESVADSAVLSTDPRPPAPMTAAATETAEEVEVEVDDAEAGLELFDSEPASAGDDSRTTRI